MVNEIDLEAFEENYRGAKSYHHRAEQFLHEGQCYSVVFNVAAVALECYLIALCELYGEKPMNHNYTCLMDTVEEIMEFPASLNKEIRSLDFIFGICSPEDYYHGIPEPADSNRVLSMCNGVRRLFDQAKISTIRAAFKNNKEE